MKKVKYLTLKNNSFSDIYLTLRKKEQRLYEDIVVKFLPNVPDNHLYKKEWELRMKSTKRIINYLKNKNKTLKILDLGCGNGWFSNQLSKIENSRVFAVDINLGELNQGNRVFQQDNLTFIYADIFKVKNFNGFDIITMNSSIQYFNDISKVIETLKSKLNTNSEIHILDSPFYKPNEIESAKKRTAYYYKNIGVSEMNTYYFHHSNYDIKDFEVLYNPSNSILKKILRFNDSPFKWLKYTSINRQTKLHK